MNRRQKRVRSNLFIQGVLFTGSPWFMGNLATPQHAHTNMKPAIFLFQGRIVCLHFLAVMYLLRGKFPGCLFDNFSSFESNQYGQAAYPTCRPLRNIDALLEEILREEHYPNRVPRVAAHYQGLVSVGGTSGENDWAWNQLLNSMHFGCAWGSNQPRPPPVQDEAEMPFQPGGTALVTRRLPPPPPWASTASTTCDSSRTKRSGIRTIAVHGAWLPSNSWYMVCIHVFHKSKGIGGMAHGCFNVFIFRWACC